MAFIHPEEEGVVFLLVRSWLVGVDARVGKVIGCRFFDMQQPPAAHHSSRFICPWLVPASVLGKFLWKCNFVSFCNCARARLLQTDVR